MGKIIVVTSGKGGVGKTTVTANIGAALAELGRNVLLMDMDFGLRNLDLLLGVENRVVYDLTDVLEGRCRARQAIIRSKRNDKLGLLPASQQRDKNAVNEEQMRNILKELEPAYDFLLLDCPAGIEQGFRNSVAGAQEAIVVCTPEIASVRDADRVIGLLAGSDVEKTQLVVNRVRAELVKRGDMMSVADVEEILGVKSIGAIPDDEQLVRAANLGEPLVYQHRSAAGAELTRIAQRLTGARRDELVKNKSGLGGLLERLLGIRAAG